MNILPSPSSTDQLQVFQFGELTLREQAKAVYANA